MLKISVREMTGRGAVLRVEGRVIGPWVEELRRACEGILGEGGRLTLDLSAVSFIDNDGIVLFQSLDGRQVGVVNCSPFVAEQLRRVLR